MKRLFLFKLKNINNLVVILFFMVLGFVYGTFTGCSNFRVLFPVMTLKDNIISVMQTESIFMAIIFGLLGSAVVFFIDVFSSKPNIKKKILWHFLLTMISSIVLFILSIINFSNRASFLNKKFILQVGIFNALKLILFVWLFLIPLFYTLIYLYKNHKRNLAQILFMPLLGALSLPVLAVLWSAITDNIYLAIFAWLFFFINLAFYFINEVLLIKKLK